MPYWERTTDGFLSKMAQKNDLSDQFKEKLLLLIEGNPMKFNQKEKKKNLFNILTEYDGKNND